MSVLRVIISKPLSAVSVAKTTSRIHAIQLRQFSSSHQRWQATPNPEQLIASMRHTKLFQDIQSNKELRDTLMEAAKVLQEEGFDMQKPSMMMMLTNSRVRETIGRVTKAVEAAGIDPSSLKEAMEVMKASMTSGPK